MKNLTQNTRITTWTIIFAVICAVVLPITITSCIDRPKGSEQSTNIVEPPAEADTLLILNQEWIEGQASYSLDLDNVDEVFWHVFSRLPEDVIVYPSENYFYFKLFVDGKQIWGNIRLAAGRRENGVLSFAYFEYRESPYVYEPRIRKSKYFTDADGLIIDEVDTFTFDVRYNQRTVTFNLNKLPQDSPKLFALAPSEEFVMRTYDESGYQFFLIYNSELRYLFWVLNEEVELPDALQKVQEDLYIGRRSGFAFMLDKANDDRKVLVAIRGANATVNNYYDGPFDQLADNYVDETNISEYLIKAIPSLEDRIDKYGYYTDKEESSRVAVSPYFVYFSDAELAQFMGAVRRAEDPKFVISKGILDRRSGITYVPTPYPTPYEGPTPAGAATPFATATPLATPTPIID